MSWTKQIFTWPMILLILLIVVFHTELYVIGVRLYVALAPSADAEYLLGEYYDNAAQRNQQFSANFYENALASYKMHYGLKNDHDKGKVAYNIGQFYACGRGTTVDATQAKQWYSEASKSTDTKIAETANKRLSELKAGSVSKDACAYTMDVQYMVRTLVH